MASLLPPRANASTALNPTSLLWAYDLQRRQELLTARISALERNIKDEPEFLKSRNINLADVFEDLKALKSESKRVTNELLSIRDSLKGMEHDVGDVKKEAEKQRAAFNVTETSMQSVREDIKALEMLKTEVEELKAKLANAELDNAVMKQDLEQLRMKDREGSGRAEEMLLVIQRGLEARSTECRSSVQVRAEIKQADFQTPKLVDKKRKRTEVVSEIECEPKVNVVDKKRSKRRMKRTGKEVLDTPQGMAYHETDTISSQHLSLSKPIYPAATNRINSATSISSPSQPNFGIPKIAEESSLFRPEPPITDYDILSGIKQKSQTLVDYVVATEEVWTQQLPRLEEFKIVNAFVLGMNDRAQAAYVRRKLDGGRWVWSTLKSACEAVRKKWEVK